MFNGNNISPRSNVRESGFKCQQAGTKNTSTDLIGTSFPGPSPPPPSQGKGPGNEAHAIQTPNAFESTNVKSNNLQILKRIF